MDNTTLCVCACVRVFVFVCVFLMSKHKNNNNKIHQKNHKTNNNNNNPPHTQQTYFVENRSEYNPLWIIRPCLCVCARARVCVCVRCNYVTTQNNGRKTLGWKRRPAANYGVRGGSKPHDLNSRSINKLNAEEEDECYYIWMKRPYALKPSQRITNLYYIWCEGQLEDPV